MKVGQRIKVNQGFWRKEGKTEKHIARTAEAFDGQHIVHINATGFLVRRKDGATDLFPSEKPWILPFHGNKICL